MNSTSKISAKALKDNRKIKVFLVFLVLTTIMWFLIALSKMHTSTAVFKIIYTNLPKDKFFQNYLSLKFLVILKGTGFSLLKFKIRKQKVTLSLGNVVKKGTAYYLLPNNQISELNAQIKGETEVVKVLSDSIFIDLGNNISKKIRVIPKVEIQFKLGYNLTEELKIIPDSVLISGPKKNLDSIIEISTNAIKLEDVFEHVNVELNLINPSKNKNVIISTKQVKINGEVDKFTEGKFILPVSIINIPKGVRVSPFPKEIDVFYQAGLSNFTKISKKDIVIVFDYQQYENDTLIKFLRPIVKQKSNYISSLKINPTQIEFLIQK